MSDQAHNLSSRPTSSAQVGIEQLPKTTACSDTIRADQKIEVLTKSDLSFSTSQQTHRVLPPPYDSHNENTQLTNTRLDRFFNDCRTWQDWERLGDQTERSGLSAENWRDAGENRENRGIKNSAGLNAGGDAAEFENKAFTNRSQRAEGGDTSSGGGDSNHVVGVEISGVMLDGRVGGGGVKEAKWLDKASER